MNTKGRIAISRIISTIHQRGCWVFEYVDRCPTKLMIAMRSIPSMTIASSFIFFSFDLFREDIHSLLLHLIALTKVYIVRYQQNNYLDLKQGWMFTHSVRTLIPENLGFQRSVPENILLHKNKQLTISMSMIQLNNYIDKELISNYKEWPE